MRSLKKKMLRKENRILHNQTSLLYGTLLDFTENRVCVCNQWPGYLCVIYVTVDLFSNTKKKKDYSYIKSAFFRGKFVEIETI